MKSIIVAAETAYGSALALIHAIKNKEQCRAIVICTDKKTFETFSSSKYIDEILYMSTLTDLAKQIKEWFKPDEHEGKPIFYFTTDNFCFYVNKNRKWFEEHFLLCLPSSEIITNYTEKGPAEIHANKSGLLVPKTQIIDRLEDIDIVLETFQFPVIIKPRATYLKKEISFKIKVVDQKGELLNLLTQLVEHNNTILCQEFIKGGNDSAFYYLFYRNEKGKIYESIGKKTLQTTPDGGTMAKGISKYNKDLSMICKSFLNEIDYRGIGGIEFKEFNGNFYFIEMSVRLEGFFKMAEISKTHLSLISYYDLSGTEIPSYLNNIKQHDGYIYMDFLSTLLIHIKYRNPLAFIKDFLHSIFNRKVKLNVYSNSDIRPFFKQFKR